MSSLVASTDTLILNTLSEIDSVRPRCVHAVTMRFLLVLLLVVVDVSVMCARCLKRPWSADQYMSELLEVIIFKNKHSIVNLIENSDNIKDKFSSLIQDIEGCPVKATRIRNLKMKKHRFDSLQRPLGRFVLFFDAVVELAVQLAMSRTGRPQEDAINFLDYIDEEKCIQLAMLADAADETTSALVRYTDTEAYDAAELHMQITSVLRRLDFLFIQGNVVAEGYTGHMLDMLSAAPRGWCVNGAHKVLGGPDRVCVQTVQACLNRMRSWCQLAADVLKAEMPSFDIMSALGIFDLSTRSKQRASNDEAYQAFLDGSLQRLAQIIEVDEPDLRAQYADYMPYADAIFTQEGTTCWAAWQKAFQFLNKKAGLSTYAHCTG